MISRNSEVKNAKYFLTLCKNFAGKFFTVSGVAKGGKLGHALWSAGLGGASAHFLQSFKNSFQTEI